MALSQRLTGQMPDVETVTLGLERSKLDCV
jgi:hypothetical protein